MTPLQGSKLFFFSFSDKEIFFIKMIAGLMIVAAEFSCPQSK
jgi:hypothetical protein